MWAFSTRENYDMNRDLPNLKARLLCDDVKWLLVRLLELHVCFTSQCMSFCPLCWAVLKATRPGKLRSSLDLKESLPSSLLPSSLRASRINTGCLPSDPTILSSGCPGFESLLRLLTTAPMVAQAAAGNLAQVFQFRSSGFGAASLPQTTRKD
jgi:hypothetical protein